MDLSGGIQTYFPWAEFQRCLCSHGTAPSLPAMPRQYRIRLINVAQAGIRDTYRPEVYATLVAATAAANDTNDSSANWRAEIEEL